MAVLPGNGSAMDGQLDRDQVLQLVEQIRATIRAGEDDDLVDLLVLRFKQSVPHPQATDLIFWPNLLGYDRELSPQEITDIALDYQPPAP